MSVIKYDILYKNLCKKLRYKYPNVAYELICDCVSDAILYILLNDIDDTPNFDDDFFYAVYNKARDKLRYEMKKNKQLIYGYENNKNTANITTNIDDKFFINDIIQNFPVKYRSLIGLLLSGLNYKEIASVQNITKSNLRKRIERLRKWLSKNKGLIF